MSKRIEGLLQKCLEAYEAGLTPEECLSPFEAERDQLEPLLRQALSLRVAFAAAPREEFRAAAGERFLFAAGREVTQALASAPDGQFVSTTRQRLLNAAGAPAQEALRNVPPPRLPFWMNARRRLLDSAAARQPVRPAFQPAVFALRAGYSAAALVMAVGVAGLLYITSDRSTSVNAELAYLERQLTVVEQQAATGAPVSSSLIEELTRRTNGLVGRLNEEPAAPLAEKLPGLIERQKDVVNTLATTETAPSTLQQAQQQLNQAEEKVRVLAARADNDPLASASTSAPSTATATPTNTPPATLAPASVPSLVPPQPAIAPPPPGYVQVRLATNDSTFNRTWTEIRTSNLRFVVPSNWRVGVSSDASGLAVIQGVIRIDGPEQEPKLVFLTYPTGQFSVLIGTQLMILRTEDGRVASLPELIASTGIYAPELSHVIDSVQVTVLPTSTTPLIIPSATPSPTGTASPTVTAAPTATATPTTTATTTAPPPPSATP